MNVDLSSILTIFAFQYIRKGIVMTSKPKNKKYAVIFLVLIAVVLVLFLSIYAALYFYSESKRPDTSADVDLCEPDWSADILSDEDYIVLNRDVGYSDGIGTWPIYSEGNYNTKDAVQLFLIDYIDDLVYGDAESLRAKYDKAVNKALDIPEKFTKQRIYESLFTELSKREMDQNGKIIFQYEFKVEYKIMKNDGTFRSDLASDSVKGQYFTVQQDGDSIKIIKVVEYAVK